MKEILYRGLDALGANALARRLHARGVAVLMYHGLVPDDSCIEAWTMVRQGAFRRQLAHLKEHYDVVPVGRALESRGRCGRRRVVLTFDDGYRSVFELAFPLLVEYGAPAMVFVTTGFTGTAEIFWYDRIIAALQDRRIRELDARPVGLGLFPLAARSPAARWDRIQLVLEAVKRGAYREREQVADWIAAQHPFAAELRERFRLLRVEDVRTMAGSGLVGFGSHTHRHEILTKLAAGEVEETIRTSVAALGGMVGSAVTTLSYPNGDHDPGVVASAARNGVSTAFTTRRGEWTAAQDRMQVPRYGVSAFDSQARFHAIVSGLAGSMGR